jgi:Flp pilus assembly CpaF family ATPase
MDRVPEKALSEAVKMLENPINFLTDNREWLKKWLRDVKSMTRHLNKLINESDRDENGHLIVEENPLTGDYFEELLQSPTIQDHMTAPGWHKDFVEWREKSGDPYPEVE